MTNKTLIIFSSFGATLLLFSCGSKKNADPMKAPPPPTVSAEIVKKGNAVYFDDYPATVAALNQNDLRAQVTGYITGIYFKMDNMYTRGKNYMKLTGNNTRPI